MAQHSAKSLISANPVPRQARKTIRKALSSPSTGTTPSRGRLPVTVIPADLAVEFGEISTVDMISLLVRGERHYKNPNPIGSVTHLIWHDAVTSGVSGKHFAQFVRSFQIVPRKDLLNVVGLSERTAQRIQHDQAKKMDVNVSDRMLQLSKVRAMAADELGSVEAAEQWLMTPAMGLEKRRPIDLMTTTDGIQLVTQLLLRIHYGVYA